MARSVIEDIVPIIRRILFVILLSLLSIIELNSSAKDKSTKIISGSKNFI